MFVARRTVFQKRELISKISSGSYTDLDKDKELTNEEPIVILAFKFKFRKGLLLEINKPPTLPNKT